jgi:stress-induced morphogen
MTTAEVKTLIESGLPGSRAQVVDLTGGGDHFEATIIAGAFEGKTLIERHRLVYQALGDAMKGPIHALTLKTYAPDENRG